ncbi:MAG: pantetheine-phosphate adenylyltransferase [Elusimicrobiaceae bacterium]|nr:pantetheine-phosphate adenylyltransferase [Elusimicrobiaceae bacterium]
MKPVVFPGSFDPVTNGHIDLIKRAKSVFGAVRVIVFYNATKQGLFTPQERVQLLQEALSGEEDVTVESSTSVLADYMKKNGLTTIVRGLRSAHDWNYERTNAYYNHVFNPGVETVFFPADEKYQFISSSLVKEAAKYGADVSKFVPPCVCEALKTRKIS